MGLYGIVRKKGFYNTTSTSTVSSTQSINQAAQKRGRPKKIVPDPHGYRKFGYHESPPSKPTSDEQTVSPAVQIPMDDSDHYYISELAKRASTIHEDAVRKVITDLENQGYTVTNEEPNASDGLVTSNNQTVSTSEEPNVSDGLVISNNQTVPTNEESSTAVRLVTSNIIDNDASSPDTDSPDSFDKLHPEAQPVSDAIEDSTSDPHETHVDVQHAIRNLWIEDVLKNRCKILVKNLTFEEIYNLRPPPIIDPYSSLEDVGDTDASDHDIIQSDEQISNKQSGINTPDLKSENVIGTITIKHEYFMRTRPSTLPDRPRRSCAQRINYAALNDPHSDSDSAPRKRNHKHIDCKSEPSEERLAAQRHFHSKDPSSMKPLQRYPIAMLPKNNTSNKIEPPDPFDVSTDDYTSARGLCLIPIATIT